jgi:putative NADH-flavin reductase
VLPTTVRSGNTENEADRASFGAHTPGEATGRYRTGGDVLLADADGNSNISGADYAKAFVDEIEQPEHRRQRFSVAY